MIFTKENVLIKFLWTVVNLVIGVGVQALTTNENKEDWSTFAYFFLIWEAVCDSEKRVKSGENYIRPDRRKKRDNPFKNVIRNAALKLSQNMQNIKKLMERKF